jgi:hypothetical protein
MDVKTIGEVIDENPLCFMMTQILSADAAENNVSMPSHGLHGNFQRFPAAITADFRLSTLESDAPETAQGNDKPQPFMDFV